MFLLFLLMMMNRALMVYFIEAFFFLFISVKHFVHLSFWKVLYKWDIIEMNINLSACTDTRD